MSIPQRLPLLVVNDVQASSAWYQRLLDADSGHGGKEYERIKIGDEILLQLHSWDERDHHGALAEPGVPVGNGVLVWFHVDDLDAVIERAAALGADLSDLPVDNPNAKQRELYLHDPDGYRVVISGA